MDSTAIWHVLTDIWDFGCDKAATASIARAELNPEASFARDNLPREAVTSSQNRWIRARLNPLFWGQQLSLSDSCEKWIVTCHRAYCRLQLRVDLHCP